MPLKFPLPWELSFREFIHQIQHKIFQTETHQLFAFRILTNPLRMAEYSTPCPIFDIGYTFRGLEGNLLDLKLDDVLRNYPVIKQQMLLILDVVEVDDKYRLQFLYRQGLPDQGTMNTLIAYFSQILKQISEKPVLLLEEILLNSKYEKQEIATDIGIDKAFNFT